MLNRARILLKAGIDERASGDRLVEGVWRTLKGFLMPRRFYDSVAELKQAVLGALRLLEAVEVQC